jgi:hypothetical protein
MTTDDLHRFFPGFLTRRFVLCALAVAIAAPGAAMAQDVPASQPAPQAPAPSEPGPQPATPPTGTPGNAPVTADDDTGKTSTRIFGVLPNYTTIEGARKIAPVSTKEKFHMAAEDAFDKPVFPFVAFTSWLSGVQGEESSWGNGPKAYAKRYATTFTDDVTATFMTTAVMPTILHQDPRYFQLGEGKTLHRAEYAATRSFVTFGRSGQSQFNYSDVTGNFIAAGAANLYHPAEDRSLTDTTLRWGTQMMWDVLSSELKEFWPDIRQKLHRR